KHQSHVIPFVIQAEVNQLFLKQRTCNCVFSELEPNQNDCRTSYNCTAIVVILLCTYVTCVGKLLYLYSLFYCILLFPNSVIYEGNRYACVVHLYSIATCECVCSL